MVTGSVNDRRSYVWIKSGVDMSYLDIEGCCQIPLLILFQSLFIFTQYMINMAKTKELVLHR